jgi:phosphate-selective porin OprO/OprP
MTRSRFQSRLPRRLARLASTAARLASITLLTWTLTTRAAVAQQDADSASITDLQRRIQGLEAVVRQMQAQGASSPQVPNGTPAGESAAAAPGAFSAADPDQVPGTPPPAGPAKPEKESLPGTPRVAGWDNGFFLQSPDKAFLFRITGQIQADYRDFLNSDDRTDIDTFLVRRARLGIEATMFNYYEFRLLPDFGGSSPQITDAYLNIHYWDALQLETGKFKQPLSYEQLIQDRYVPTMERSLIDQLVPARDEGVMIHGRNLFEGRLDYALAVSNGEINGNADTNKYKDFNGRIAIRPFSDPGRWDVLRRLQIGVSGGVGIENEAVSPRTLRTPATVPWFAFNSTVQADGIRYRLSPEVAYFYGPLGLAAQYYHEQQQLRPSATSAVLEDVPFDGFYVLATCFLTGEERTDYSQQIDPIRPFDLRCPFRAPGAWELVFRVSRLDLSDQVFSPGQTNLADPTKYSSGATEATCGFNWYFNKWARSQFNWEHAWFDDPVKLGVAPTPYLKRQDTLLARLQFIF